MAIAYGHLIILMDLRRQNVIGPGLTERVLDLGEQNWFGDVAPSEIARIIDMFGGAASDALRDELSALLGRPTYATKSFDLAALFYRVIFGCQHYRAIDLGGTDRALKLDLNEPVSLDEQFDLVTNIGTGEHIFNQYQFYRTAHERTRSGGLMYHALPHQGAYDHGFYNYQPTFVFDLAEANRYELLLFVYVDSTRPPGQQHVQIRQRADYIRLASNGQVSAQGGLHAVFRKANVEDVFRVPCQGYYANTLPPELAAAWRSMDR